MEAKRRVRDCGSAGGERELNDVNGVDGVGLWGAMGGCGSVAERTVRVRVVCCCTELWSSRLATANLEREGKSLIPCVLRANRNSSSVG